MNKVRILISLVIAICAVWFVSRHKTLRAVKTEHSRLEQNLERSSSHTSSVPTIIPAPETVATLSAAERSELLRLRGEVGGLRRDLMQLTNRPPGIPRQASPEAIEPVIVPLQSSADQEKFSLGRRWMMALLMYTREHENRLPATLAEAARWGNLNTNDVESYELVTNNLALAIPPSMKIVLRESRPSRTPAGRWVRVYGFGDGHIEEAIADTEDFTEWEESSKPRHRE